MKRRDFLKTAALAGTAVSMGPLFKGVSFAQTAKSKVVIANDPLCLVNNVANATRIQDMVDHVIMALTGITDKGLAYEAIFPKAVTTATKIVLYNATQAVSHPSLSVVCNALKTGLTSMLGGTFPAANVTTFSGGGTPAAANPQFTVGTTVYRIQDAIVNCDYFINVPVCWATTAALTGVTVSLKHMMGSVGVGTLSNFHNYFTSTTSPCLSILSSQPTYKNKQALVLMDGIAIRSDSGPGGSANKTAFSIVASKDMVAVDYQGMLILKANGLTSDRETTARTTFTLAAQAPYSLGTNDPNNMDIVNIAPWTTSVTSGGYSGEKLGLKVSIGHRSGLPHVVFGLDSKAIGPVGLSIFSIDGSKIWLTNSLQWNGETFGSAQTGRGTYLYSIKAGRELLRGQIFIDN